MQHRSGDSTPQKAVKAMLAPDKPHMAVKSPEPQLEVKASVTEQQDLLKALVDRLESRADMVALQIKLDNSGREQRLKAKGPSNDVLEGDPGSKAPIPGEEAAAQAQPTAFSGSKASAKPPGSTAAACLHNAETFPGAVHESRSGHGRAALRQEEQETAVMSVSTASKVVPGKREDNFGLEMMNTAMCGDSTHLIDEPPASFILPDLDEDTSLAWLKPPEKSKAFVPDPWFLSPSPRLINHQVCIHILQHLIRRTLHGN